MPAYRYQALDHKGKKKKGHLESESQDRAFGQFQEQGLTPIELSRVTDETVGIRSRVDSWFRISNPFGKKVRIEEAFYYLGLMLQGGVLWLRASTFLVAWAGLFRLDFSAVIKTVDGERKNVLIEIQKADEGELDEEFHIVLDRLARAALDKAIGDQTFSRRSL